MKRRKLSPLFTSALTGVLTLVPAAHVAYCAIYLSEDQAAAQLLPGQKLAARWLELTDAEAKEIETRSGENVRTRKLRVHVGSSGDSVYIDQVLGKHEFITFAVAVSALGKVKGVEILEYKETYGSEVRRPEWRAQFVGKDTTAALKVDKDVQNISGATLSSVHLAGGVRRILQTHALIKPRLAAK